MCTQTMLYVRNNQVRAQVKRAAAIRGQSMSNFIETTALAVIGESPQAETTDTATLEAIRKICRAALEHDVTLVDDVMVVLDKA